MINLILNSPLAINLIVIVSTVTVFCALFILRTKTIGEWSLLVFSYGCFLLFVLYWKSGSNKLDSIAIVLLFVSAFFNSVHEIMGALCWDFVFQIANGGIKKITWNEVLNGKFEHIVKKNVKFVKKDMFESDIVRYTLEMTHPVFIERHYILNFECEIEVKSGEVEIIYDKQTLILRTGDFVVIKRKEIHAIKTVKHTVFKFSCRK